MELVGWGLLSTEPTLFSLSSESLVKSLGTACFFSLTCFQKAYISRERGGGGPSVANILSDEQIRI